MKELNRKNSKAAAGNEGETVEVLYQKMGNRWFAFSLVNDEVFVGSITQEKIDELEAEASERTYHVTGNS